jgi:peptidoglycan hydrolase-like protein with peptidoglycan-binding domain
MAPVLIVSPPNVLLRVFYGIDLAVGAHRPNRPDDVKLVQFFLRSLSRINDVVTRESYFPSGQALLEADGFYGPQTAAYIKHFEAVLSRAAPGGGPMKPWQDGVIDPKPPGLSFGPVHHRAYSRNLETHKAQLKRDSDAELEKFKGLTNREVEKLKSQLSIAAAERHVRFARLHDKRAEVIAEIYKLVATAHTAVESFVAADVPFNDPEPPPWQKRAESADEAIRALRNYFVPNAIFAPKPVSDIIIELSKQYGSGPFFRAGWSWRAKRRRKAGIFEAGYRDYRRPKSRVGRFGAQFRMLLGDELEKTN